MIELKFCLHLKKILLKLFNIKLKLLNFKMENLLKKMRFKMKIQVIVKKMLRWKKRVILKMMIVRENCKLKKIKKFYQKKLLKKNMIINLDYLMVVRNFKVCIKFKRINQIKVEFIDK